jgi:hypothetical protein
VPAREEVMGRRNEDRGGQAFLGVWGFAINGSSRTKAQVKGSDP